MSVIEVRHPLVKHKIGLLREVDSRTGKFRELSAELAQGAGRLSQPAVAV